MPLFPAPPTQGQSTLDFGSGSDAASLVVTGQGGISTASTIIPFMMADSTADHNAYEHVMAPIRLVCGDVVDDVGFTIFATSDVILTGTFIVRWQWQ